MNAIGLLVAICLGLCTPVGQQGGSVEQGLIPVLEYLGSLSDVELDGVFARGAATTGEGAAVATQAHTSNADPITVQTAEQAPCADDAPHCAEQPVLEGAVSHAATAAGAADAVL